MDLGAWSRGEDRSFYSELLRLPLIPLGVLYGSAASARRALGRICGPPPRRWPVPVISVGNLVVGGTGKTPCVRVIAERLLALGKRPLVVARGYGARAPGSTLDEEGDDLLRSVPGLRCVQGADRWRAATADPELLRPPTVVILDDGAQRVGEFRDLEILLFDARRPWGAGWPLPAGALREWPLGVRADLCLVTRAQALSEAERAAVRMRLGRIGETHFAHHRPTELLQTGRPASSLDGRRVFLASGIARPAGFAETVRSLGAQVIGERRLADHAAWTAAEIESVLAEATGAELILSTSKDRPKLLRPDPPAPHWDFLGVRLEIETPGELRLQDLLAKLGGGSRDGS